VVRTALRLRPDHAEAHYTLGGILAQQGKPKLPEAQGQFEAALRVRPQDPRIRRALAEVLQRRGRTAEAQRELKLAQDQENLLRTAGPGGSER